MTASIALWGGGRFRRSCSSSLSSRSLASRNSPGYWSDPTSWLLIRSTRFRSSACCPSPDRSWSAIMPRDNILTSSLQLILPYAIETPAPTKAVTRPSLSARDICQIALSWIFSGDGSSRRRRGSIGQFVAGLGIVAPRAAQLSCLSRGTYYSNMQLFAYNFKCHKTIKRGGTKPAGGRPSGAENGSASAIPGSGTGRARAESHWVGAGMPRTGGPVHVRDGNVPRRALFSPDRRMRFPDGAQAVLAKRPIRFSVK